ncbi:MAG TPA: hypothetical protein VK721_13840 [Solirubrobacteraceae bacterium]|jgi:hypothetical protein|nr:hypothetical protein [Solirubrobacteraceae bacterium]
MASIHLIALLVELLLAFWDPLGPGLPFLLVPLALWLLWVLLISPRNDQRALEAHDRLRHERAQREIHAIERAAIHAMFNAAQTGEVIDGTGAEVEPRHRRPR